VREIALAVSTVLRPEVHQIVEAARADLAARIDKLALCVPASGSVVGSVQAAGRRVGEVITTIRGWRKWFSDNFVTGGVTLAGILALLNYLQVPVPKPEDIPNLSQDFRESLRPTYDWIVNTLPGDLPLLLALIILGIVFIMMIRRRSIKPAATQ
jgi:hypothetical protein